MIKENSTSMEKVCSYDKNLIKIVTIIVEISCIEIPKFYEDNENIIHDNEIAKKFIKKKEIILKKIISILLNFDIDIKEKNENVQGCSGLKFLEKFRDDRLVILILFNNSL